MKYNLVYTQRGFKKQQQQKKTAFLSSSNGKKILAKGVFRNDNYKKLEGYIFSLPTQNVVFAMTCIEAIYFIESNFRSISMIFLCDNYYQAFY